MNSGRKLDYFGRTSRIFPVHVVTAFIKSLFSYKYFGVLALLMYVLKVLNVHSNDYFGII